jgi:LPXTG-site transpeptidase (sortase) family protein
VEVAPTPFAMSGSEPVTVRIPAIGVRSRLMDLGLDGSGQLEVPPGAFPAGWFTGAPTPGELGPAIITGHVRWGPQPGVFAELGRIGRGDKILVSRRNGSTAIFRVSDVRRFDKQQFPTKRVYGDIGHAGLRLITCGGLDRRSSRYEDNVVVFAELVRARTV